MNRLLNNSCLAFLLRLIVGTVFIAAGMAKARDPQAFIQSLKMFQLFPTPVVVALSQGLPCLEMICGALLVGGWFKRSVVFSLLILNALFIIVLSQAILRGVNVECGCFGSLPEMPSSPWVTLGRDGLLMVMLAFIYGNTCLKNYHMDLGKVLAHAMPSPMQANSSTVSSTGNLS